MRAEHNPVATFRAGRPARPMFLGKEVPTYTTSPLTPVLAVLTATITLAVGFLMGFGAVIIAMGGI